MRPGRDTRGLLRVHEFDKVELFAYATPEQAPDCCTPTWWPGPRRCCSDLGLQYRVLDLCTGDLGISAARTFDLEVYAPGRRPVAGGLLGQLVHRLPGPAGQRPLPAERGGGGPVLVHTLNGSALAWARIWAALVETGRQADGSVVLPEVLRPYLGGRGGDPRP